MRVVLFTSKGRENGDVTIRHPLLVAVAVPSVADRRIRAGTKRLEEVVVDNWTTGGRMGVGAVGGVGGPERGRRASTLILGVNATI